MRRAYELSHTEEASVEQSQGHAVAFDDSLALHRGEIAAKRFARASWWSGEAIGTESQAIHSGAISPVSSLVLWHLLQPDP
jgi:hypothetical protein